MLTSFTLNADSANIHALFVIPFHAYRVQAATNSMQIIAIHNVQ